MDIRCLPHWPFQSMVMALHAVILGTWIRPGTNPNECCLLRDKKREHFHQVDFLQARRCSRTGFECLVLVRSEDVGGTVG